MIMKRAIKRKLNKTILWAVILLMATIYIYPIYLMCINSVKSFQQVLVDVLSLPNPCVWGNFSYVMEKMKYGILFRNNVIITALAITGIVAFSAVAAYIINRRSNRYSSIVYKIIILPMLIPFQTIMISLLKVTTIFHLSGSKIGLGIQYWGFGIPMATFIFFNFITTVPFELDESAEIDGATTFQTFMRIIFPLLKPVTFTVIVIDVMWIWNDFLLPLLMVNDSNETKTLVLAAYTFVGQFNTQWQYAMAAMVLALLPSVIIFIFLQKYIVQGVVAGAVKG